MTGTDTITAFADTNTDGSQDNGEPGDTAGKTWVTPVSTPCAVKITNGGWITADDGNKANFGGNAQAFSDGSLSGQETFQDKGANINIKSSTITAVTCPSPTQAKIFGTATNNGSGAYNFEIDVQDGATIGQQDMYGISVSNGNPFYASGGHAVGGGNIDIHKTS
jgi:hypothetical protein